MCGIRNPRSHYFAPRHMRWIEVDLPASPNVCQPRCALVVPDLFSGFLGTSLDVHAAGRSVSTCVFVSGSRIITGPRLPKPFSRASKCCWPCGGLLCVRIPDHCVQRLERLGCHIGAAILAVVPYCTCARPMTIELPLLCGLGYPYKLSLVRPATLYIFVRLRVTHRPSAQTKTIPSAAFFSGALVRPVALGDSVPLHPARL